MSNQFSALAHPDQRGNGQRRGGNSRGIAGGTLRKAGLIDEDLGMRDASAGPSRRGGRARSGASSGNGSTPMTVDDSSARNGGGRRARERSNPMGRPGKGSYRNSADGKVSGQAFGIRGAAARPTTNNRGGSSPSVDLLTRVGQTKGKGRTPGGGGITQGNAPGQATTGRSIALLKQFLASRWIADASFLNLDSMGTDPLLAEEGLKPPGTSGAHKDIGSVLFKLCSELYPGVVTLSLAKNDLKTLTPVSTLPEFLPNIKNLSLESNDIKWTRDLTFQRGRHTPKFHLLKELILVGNPVHDNAAAAANEEGYRSEVLARFPTLSMLDRREVTSKEHNFANLPAAGIGKDKTGVAGGAANAGVEVREFPVAVKSGFADEAAGNIIPSFLSKFFDTFDNNRDSLRAAYTTSAIFTISLLRSVPPRAKSAGYLHTLPRQKDLNWKVYSNVTDHNVMHLGTKAASKGVPRGPGAILGLFNKLPKTKHPLTDPAKFVVDGWVIPNTTVNATFGVTAPGQPTASVTLEKPDAVLFISVHGEFAEGPSYGSRSFDRTFIVAPVPPGSTAANLGWPCVIISDQLTVRNYAGSDSWSEKQQGSLDRSSSGAGTESAPGLTPEQHSLSLHLAAQTGLKYDFAIQCLSENQWNPQQALQIFQGLKEAGSIPAEAFV